MRDRLGETLCQQTKRIFFFSLVESRGQVFMYNRGKKWKKKPDMVSLSKEREREKLG
jgi:hypothetical protein